MLRRTEASEPADAAFAHSSAAAITVAFLGFVAPKSGWRPSLPATLRNSCGMEGEGVAALLTHTSG
ncbi:MAG: hypothetical protein ACO2PM_14720 [Pyrobaculum sp.]